MLCDVGTIQPAADYLRPVAGEVNPVQPAIAKRRFCSRGKYMQCLEVAKFLDKMFVNYNKKQISREMH